MLRFDYYGTGDSSGEGSDADLTLWSEDLDEAVEELRAISGVMRVSLVGVRLGAALALRPPPTADDIQDAALWDPVVRGRRYLGELLRARRTAGTRGGTELEVYGYPLPGSLREQLDALDLTEGSRAGADAAWGFSSPIPIQIRRSWANEWDEMGIETERRDFPEPGIWTDRKRMGNAVLAPDLVAEVCAWLS